MTVKDFEVLKKYDEKWESVAAGAKHISYATIAMRKDCTPIYNNLFGRTPSNAEWNCSHCAFNLYKDIALKYVEYKNNKKVKKGKKNGMD